MKMSIGLYWPVKALYLKGMYLNALSFSLFEMVVAEQEIRSNT